MKKMLGDEAFHYQLSSCDVHLQQVLQLQAQNLPQKISAQELEKEGFVTVEHNLDSLREICGSYGHMLAYEQEKLIAYGLVMLKEHADTIPVLKPMFEQINRLSMNGQPLCEQPYLVMGQVCVDKAHRGTGVFKELYQQMARHLSPYFRYIITEVASRNPRSIRAHQKVGFQTIHQFKDATDDWQIILWDWQNKK